MPGSDSVLDNHEGLRPRKPIQVGWLYDRVVTHIVVAADVDSRVRHIGDEAMFDALVEHLRMREADLRVTVLSNDPEAVSRRHGVESARKLSFPVRVEDEAERDLLLRQVLDAARVANNGRTIDSNEDARQFVELIRDADAVVVAGGGNLTSLWPQHVYERVALLRVASILNRPTVVTGQSIGPELTARDASLLAEALSGADLVGVRERSSWRLCAQLGVDPTRLMLAPDDALTLGSRPDPEVEELRGIDLGEPWIAVTVTGESLGLDGNREAQTLALANQLAELANECEAPLVFLPHFTGPDGRTGGDADSAQAVVAAIRLLNPQVNTAVAPVVSTRGLAWLTGRSALVVSARYHGLVFALTAAVPSLAIYYNEHTESKMRGLLELAGVGDWRLPAEALGYGAFANAVREAWSRRRELREHLTTRSAILRTAAERHWSSVGAVIGLNPPETGGAELVDYEESAQPLGGWSRADTD